VLMLPTLSLLETSCDGNGVTPCRIRRHRTLARGIRAFTSPVRRFCEEALHNYHPDVCIPYCDWTKPEGQHFPDRLVGVLPAVQTPTRTIHVVRSPRPAGGLASIAGQTPNAMTQTNYGQFSGIISGIHGSVHIWVRGTMYASVSVSSTCATSASRGRMAGWYASPSGGARRKTPSKTSVWKCTFRFRPLPEALDDRERASAAVADAMAVGLAPVESEQRSRVHCQYGPGETVVPRQQVPQPIGQREHPY